MTAWAVMCGMILSLLTGCSRKADSADAVTTLKAEGDNLVAAGEFTRALEKFEQAVKIKPDDPGLYYRIAQLGEKLDARKKSLQAIVRLESLRPDAVSDPEVQSLKTRLKSVESGKGRLAVPASQSPTAEVKLALATAQQALNEAVAEAQGGRHPQARHLAWMARAELLPLVSDPALESVEAWFLWAIATTTFTKNEDDAVMAFDGISRLNPKYHEDEKLLAVMATLNRMPIKDRLPLTDGKRDELRAGLASQPVHGRSHRVALDSALAIDLVFVPPGTFSMGSPGDEAGRFPNEKMRRVNISQGFWLGKTEVTQAQWLSVMGTTVVDQVRKVFPEEKNIESKCGHIGDTMPIIYVNWDEAMAFCAKLTRGAREAGRIPSNYEYTLPTEAQWEYACRAGSTGAIYSGAWAIVGENNAPALDPIAWYGGNSSVNYHAAWGWKTDDWKEKQYPGGLAGPRSVGQKQPNAWGLHDMIGNVWEWCTDWYGEYPDTGAQRADEDPRGASSGSNRVIRGGSWGNDAAYCRAAYRLGYSPGFRDYYVGFRLALSPVRE